MTRRRKRIIGSVLAIPLIIIAIHFTFYSTLKDIVHAEKSVNPIATDSFAHAASISWYIGIAHNYLYINYDSSLLNPLYKLENYFFKEGQKYLAKDNLGEEGVWWYLINSDRYDFTIQKRVDLSVTLSARPKEESLAIRDRLYNYFLAITDIGIQGVEFGKFKSDTVHGLFDGIYGDYAALYPFERNNKIVVLENDFELMDREVILYEQYKTFIADDPFIDRYKYVYHSILNVLEPILFSHLYHKKTSIACGSLLMDYLDIFINPKINKKNVLSFDYKYTKIILRKVKAACPNRKVAILSAEEQINRNWRK